MTDDAAELRAQLQAVTGECIAALEGIGEMRRNEPEKPVEAERRRDRAAGTDIGRNRDDSASLSKGREMPARERSRARKGTSVSHTGDRACRGRRRDSGANAERRTVRCGAAGG